VSNALGLRTGDWVRVRTPEEILATLDERGCLDAMPFMPEMLELCGKELQVSGIAHKTCDTARFSGGRAMRDAVFLEDHRCDGSAHGGCQARCLFFWKTDWLVPIAAPGQPARADGPRKQARISLEQLRRTTQKTSETGEVLYVCQATEHMAATKPLHALAPWHFLEDLRTRNATFGQVLQAVVLHLVYRLRGLPFAWSLNVWLYATLHKLLTGRPDPFRNGVIAKGAPTPELNLDLKPGEWVEVKSHDEILQTLNKQLRNRGLAYNAEMTPECGRRLQVAQRITTIIEEKSGRMISMKNPCITLEKVYCQALYTDYSLVCSRRVTPYFREAWLRRVPRAESKDGGAHGDA
jgi:hypothetical protein